MAEPNRIPVASLQSVCRSLLERLGQLQGEFVHIEKDYFWSIVRDERYEVSIKPTTLTIGQITECWSNLEMMLEDPTREITFGLVWLAEIFRSIGDEIIS